MFLYTVGKMRGVLLLSLALCCCAQEQSYHLQYVLIADTCCGDSNVRFLGNVGVQYRKAGSDSWESLHNLTNIES